MDTTHLINGLVGAVVFSLVGLAIFVFGFFVIRKILPYDVHKEIEQDQNTALGIVIASFVLGLAIIIASALH